MKSSMCEESYQFRLYVTGSKAEVTVALIQQVCESVGCLGCDLTVIDILEDPDAANEDNILATPALLRLNPKPVMRLVGDLSNKERILKALKSGTSHPSRTNSVEED